VFKLKFATTVFIPALADPYAFIYEKKILDTDPHWYETHVMGSGPFHFVSYQIGQEIKGERNPDYYIQGLPYLDGFTGIYSPKEAVRVAAIKSDRAAIEFRGMPPTAVSDLKASLGDRISVQTSDWNCGNVITPNSSRKPFDDVRVRKALLLAVDQWNGAPALSKIAVVRTVGGIVFPGSPLAATKAELEQLAGFYPDIEKSRAEARRLLKEAGQEHLKFELLNRNVDQPYKFIGTWVIDQWSKIGVTVTQKVVPTGPWFAAMRSGDFDVVSESNCNSIVNPVLDTQKYLPQALFSESYGRYSDPVAADIYQKMLHETDPAKQRVLMRAYEKQVVDVEAHAFPMLWWNRIVTYRSYVKGWKIGPSHFINQDLATIWLDK
jgi:peptide/nickel transport system substrate-binding protein